eukprot:m.140428 g.140428  ORF g.140428 m.140428 type:complete len:184 (-) comp24107_c0_seq1:42-593(-)
MTKAKRQLQQWVAGLMFINKRRSLPRACSKAPWQYFQRYGKKLNLPNTKFGARERLSKSSTLFEVFTLLMKDFPMHRSGQTYPAVELSIQERRIILPPVEPLLIMRRRSLCSAGPWMFLLAPVVGQGEEIVVDKGAGLLVVPASPTDSIGREYGFDDNRLDHNNMTDGFVSPSFFRSSNWSHP